MPRLLVLMLWAMLSGSLAGCVGDAPPEPAADVDDGSSDDAAPPDGAGSEAPPLEPVESVVELDGSGRTSMGAWLCDDSGCEGEEVEGGEFMVLFEYPGTPSAVALTVEWTGSDPTLERMYAEVLLFGDDGIVPVADTEGVSPVVFDVPVAAGAPANGTLHVHLWPAAEASTPAGNLYVDPTRTPFSVTGTLITEVWPDA